MGVTSAAGAIRGAVGFEALAQCRSGRKAGDPDAARVAGIGQIPIAGDFWLRTMRLGMEIQTPKP